MWHLAEASFSFRIFSRSFPPIFLNPKNLRRRVIHDQVHSAALTKTYTRSHFLNKLPLFNTPSSKTYVVVIYLLSTLKFDYDQIKEENVISD